MVRIFRFDASLVYIYIYSTNIPPIVIINRIYENQNLLSLKLVSFLVGLRTYQHPCSLFVNSGTKPNRRRKRKWENLIQFASHWNTWRSFEDKISSALWDVERFPLATSWAWDREGLTGRCIRHIFLYQTTWISARGEEAFGNFPFWNYLHWKA